MKMNMKKIISWGMMLAAAFTLTNCAKEIDAPVQEPETVGYPFEIVASTVDTKTVNDGIHTQWAEGDKINLFHTVGETTEYVDNKFFTVSNLAEGRFTGNLAGELDSQEEYDWFAFYPYSSYIKTPANTSSGYMTVGSSASGVQVQKGNGSMSHIAGENYPLVGRAIAVPANSTPKMVMSHVSSLIAVNVKNTLEEPLVVESVSFNAPVEIVGTYYINFTGDITPESFTGSGEQYVSKAATLKVEEGTEITTGQSAVFYLAVKPFVAKANDKLVVTVNGHAKELTMTKDVTFSAGKIKTLNFAYDKVKEAGVETGTISFATDAQRTSFSGEAQVWDNDGITFTNTKASSTNAVVNNVAPVRLYKSSDIKIEAPGFITKIEFNSATGDYFANLKALLPNASVSGQVVTEVYDGSSTSVSYSLTTGQVRLNSITVTYSSEGYVAKTLESIAVSGDYKSEFTQGDDFSFGGVITATYSDESTKTIAEKDCTFSGYNMETVGKQTVTVTYEGKTATYDINVAEAQVDGDDEESGWVSTAFADLKDGDQVVIVSTKSSNIYAMSNNNGTGSAPAAVAVEYSNDKLSSEPEAKLVWTVEISGSNYIFHPGSDNTKWLYCTSTNNGVRVGTNTTKTFVMDASGYLKHVATSRYLGVYNNQDWRCYTNTTGNTAGQTFQFFVNKGGSSDSGETPKEPVVLTMSEVTCSEKTENSLTFTWPAVEGATAYQVYFDGADKGEITTTTYLASDLEAGSSHTIAVKAVGDGTDYATSETASTCTASTEEQTETPEEPGGDQVQSVTVSNTIKNIASAKGWTNGTKYSSFNLDEVITIAATGNSNTGKYYTSGNEWRIYQTENPKVQISAAEGYTIKTVKITYNVSNTGVLKLNGSNIASGTAVSVNVSSVEFNVGNTGTATNGQVKVTAIEVVYQKN